MIFETLATGLVAGALTYAITRKIDRAKYEIYVEQAKQKARAIEVEAQLLLEQQKTSIKEKEFELKKRAEAEIEEMKRESHERTQILNKEIADFEALMQQENRLLDEKRTAHDQHVKAVCKEHERLEKLQNNYRMRLDELLASLNAITGMTIEEAKELAIERTQELVRSEMAHVVRKAESEAKEEAKKRANYIIAQATTRFAGEFASERLINTITLPSDELKGRIIGKEGRNIKALEMLLGVDIIIDDTPGAIIVSSFNLYRRSIATRTIELLIEDGRIQPTRIEEIFAKVTEEFEESLMQEGRNIIMDLGIGDLPDELIRLVGRLKFRASYGQNALAHSLEVAHLSGIIAAELDGDERLAKRAGLLHDIGKALTQDYEGNHVDLGADLCKRYKEHPVVINAIYAHHGHEDAKTIEAAAVCTADALSAARPGARREVLENFLKRVQEIEVIATSKHGVSAAYAISAGREVRVIANATLINDHEASLLAREIADEIQQGVQYPGEIKVNVIREVRAVEIAK